MTAPERIWARDIAPYGLDDLELGCWWHKPEYGDEVEYVRADLADTATWNAAIHKAAAIADSRVEAYGAKMRAATDKTEKRDWQSMLFAAVDIEHAILALLKEEKT